MASRRSSTRLSGGGTEGVVNSRKRVGQVEGDVYVNGDQEKKRRKTIVSYRYTFGSRICTKECDVQVEVDIVARGSWLMLFDIGYR